MKRVSSSDRTTLLLDYGWNPLGILTARSAFKHLIKNRVKALDKNFNSLDFKDWFDGYGDLYKNQPCLTSSNDVWAIPTISIITEKFFRINTQKRTISFRDLCTFYNHKCQICLQVYPASRLSVEHVKPKSKGGTDCMTNKTLTCRKCNSRKGNIFPYTNIDGMELSGVKLNKNALIVDQRIIREEWARFL